MAELFTFFVIIFAGLIFSQLFNRLHLPYVTALVVAGVIVGPFGLNLIEFDAVVSFLASVGVVFLMFIAGSEIKTEHLQNVGRQAVGFAAINGLIPFAIGVLIGVWFGLPLLTSVVLGVIFISSSVAVIVPSLERFGLLRNPLGETILAATVLEDVGSLLILSFFLQGEGGPLPPVLSIGLVVVILILLRIFIPRLRKLAQYDKRGDDLFESDLRFVFGVLLATVVIFELIGLHAIVAGFLIGMVLSDLVRGKVAEKIHTVGYGLFIPAFFLVIGMQMDLTIFFSPQATLLVMAILVGSVLAKMVSGWLAGKLVGFKGRERWLAAVITIPSLSTTLAAAFTASEFGILSTDVVSALIILSVVTTLIAPLMLRWIVARKDTKELNQA